MANLVLSAPSFTIHYKDTFLVIDREGWIHEGQTRLFSADTRYLSTYHLTLNGFEPQFLGADRPHYFAATFSYTNPAIGVKPWTIAANSLLLTVSRFVRDGVHEDIDLTNYAGRPINLSLVLGVGVDFADIFQVRGLAPVIPRLAQSHWDRATKSLNLHYRKKGFVRTLHLRFVEWTSRPTHGVGKIFFDATLQPGETWHTCVEAYFEDHPAFNHAEAHAIEPVVEELEHWLVARPGSEG
ncbi:MAG TPA: glycogen debranching N-terminal domain-containing protein [Chloroflexota bacterium]|nr:glycogen debranching N-terminal domain-containing protein [Chloroflexota bacterium]